MENKKNFYNESISELYERLDTNIHGLSLEEAKKD